MSHPELSVVIVSYRCADLLAECLDSLALNRADVDMEVMVVDNASGDDTVAVAERYPWVQVEALDDNLGFARANNRAMNRARGRAMLVLNPDTVLPEGSLRRCLDYLWADPAIGVLSPRLVDGQGRLDRRCRRGFPTIWALACYTTGLDRVLPGPRARWYTMGHIREDRTIPVDSVSGAFMLIRARALQVVGGFDQQFFMYAEDLDLCMRFNKAGFRVVYWPGESVMHAGGGCSANGMRSPRANAAYYRTLVPLMRKHRPGVAGYVSAVALWLAGELILAGDHVKREWLLR